MFFSSVSSLSGHRKSPSQWHYPRNFWVSPSQRPLGKYIVWTVLKVKLTPNQTSFSNAYPQTLFKQAFQTLDILKRYPGNQLMRFSWGQQTRHNWGPTVGPWWTRGWVQDSAYPSYETLGGQIREQDGRAHLPVLLNERHALQRPWDGNQPNNNTAPKLWTRPLINSIRVKLPPNRL